MGPSSTSLDEPFPSSLGLEGSSSDLSIPPWSVVWPSSTSLGEDGMPAWECCVRHLP